MRLVTSMRVAKASMPPSTREAAASAGPSGSTSAMHTRAPSRAKRVAVARPMPRPAPVTSATLPSSLPTRLLSNALAGTHRNPRRSCGRVYRPEPSFSVRATRRRADAVVGAPGVALRDDHFSGEAGQAVPDVELGLLKGCDRAVAGDNPVTNLGCYLGDAGTHRAGAENADGAGGCLH